MRFLGAFLATTFCAHGAVLQGFVFDAEAGRALARTNVILTPLAAGTAGGPQALRTESNGSFFFGVPPGV